MANLTGTTSHRIRIGLTGLAFAVLLVLIGSAISRSGGDPPPPTDAQREAEAEPKEPLAELGVAPGPTTSETPANSSSSRR